MCTVRPQPPPVAPDEVMHVAERARRFLRPLLGTDVSLESVERETGVAWCPVPVGGGRVLDPFLSMRLHSMSDRALEEFLKHLEGVVASMPEACICMQARSDSAAVCAELWNELREPLATWVDVDEFASHVHAVCERISSHYITMAVAQLVEQLAGMRTLARVCCTRGPEEGSGVGVVQQAVQDEAFVRTVTTPCAILKEEMKQARVPLEELSTCLSTRRSPCSPAALAPCAVRGGWAMMDQEHGSGASPRSRRINRVRRLTDPALDRGAWSASPCDTLLRRDAAGERRDAARAHAPARVREARGRVDDVGRRVECASAIRAHHERPEAARRRQGVAAAHVFSRRAPRPARARVCGGAGARGDVLERARLRAARAVRRRLRDGGRPRSVRRDDEDAAGTRDDARLPLLHIEATAAAVR